MSGAITFLAEAFDKGVLLKWNVGSSNADSTTADLAEVTIQFSTLTARTKLINGPDTVPVPNIVPNTPPYVVRELQQPQHTNNVLYHPNLINGATYTYTLFVHYMDTGMWSKAVVSNSVIPTDLSGSPLVSGSLEFNKLGVNTRLASIRDSQTTLVVWLSDDQVARKTELESAVDQLKPAHVRTSILYEPYYVAQTTTTQFSSGSYDSGSYDVSEGTLKLKVPTIDFSFSGERRILGGS